VSRALIEMIGSAASYGFTEEQLKEYTETFQLMDKTESGMLAPYELGILMRSLGHNPTDDELNTIVQEYDSYVKGGISLSDFLVVMKNREQDSELRTRLLKIFQIFDRDGNGYISVDELKTQMMSVGKKEDGTEGTEYSDKEWEEFMSEATAPGMDLITPDGRLEYTEFVKLMTNKVQ